MKFRAYDPTTGKMYYPPNEHIYLNIDGTCHNFQNGEILEPMFGLGVMDLGGKDVYDGDIWKDEKGVVWMVFMCEEFQNWALNRGERTLEGDNIVRYDTSRLSWGEVVGNIKLHKLEDFK